MICQFFVQIDRPSELHIFELDESGDDSEGNNDMVTFHHEQFVLTTPTPLAFAITPHRGYSKSELFYPEIPPNRAGLLVQPRDLYAKGWWNIKFRYRKGSQ